MDPVRTTRRTGGVCIAALGAALFTACSSGHDPAIDGILIVDEEVMLERSTQVDIARREYAVEEDATFVALVEEDDCNVKIRLTHKSAQGIAAEANDVDSNLLNAGIDMALHVATRGARLTISLEGPQNFDRPGKVRLKIFRYRAGTASDPRVQARLAAVRAWATATSANFGDGSAPDDAIRNIDLALTHFESSDGDPALAAWARLIRSRLNSRGLTDIRSSLLDARRAARSFAALGAARNAARARLMEVSVLQEFALDRSARNPTAEEAVHGANEVLTSLSSDHSLSANESAQVVNYLGVNAFIAFDWADARVKWQAAVPLFEAIGSRVGQLQTLQNLAVLAAEQGDFLNARQHFTRLLTVVDHVGSVGTRTLVVYNAAGVDLRAGYIDEAIELLLRGLEMTREHNLRQNEARMLAGLGSAYEIRGDFAQAMTLNAAALKLRRTIDDPGGLLESLIAYGRFARDAGKFAQALAAHTEANSLSTADMRVHTMLQLALDYAAASDHERAIATCREILALNGADQKFFMLPDVRITLAESLLAQPRRTSQAVSEATILAGNALNAASLHDDMPIIVDSHRILAQAHIARGEVQEAREEYRRAIALIFDNRINTNNPKLRTSTWALEQRTFRGYFDLLMRDAVARGPNKLLPVSAFEEEALRALEWARAINFDSAQVAHLDAATQARVDDLLTEMAGKRIGIAALLERSDDVSRQLENLRLDVAKLRAQLDRLRAASAREPQAPSSSSFDAPWPAVAEGVTQLSYLLETGQSYLWVRDSTGIRVTVLSASPAGIARDLATLDEAIRSRKPLRIEATLERLSRVLIPAEAIAGGTKTIEIVADGHIDGIPFAALSPPGSSGHLTDRLSMAMITSLFESSTLSPSVEHRALQLVGLASEARSSAGSPEAAVFSTLQNTNAEVHAIAAMFQSRDPGSTIKLLSGAEGSADNLRKYWQAGIDVIHFATHGLPDLHQPLTSLLLLPARDAAGKPAYLTAGQVVEWRGNVDLVFLGACDTAVGPVRFAEGMSGMQGAFLRAGAHGVIATLWPVEDLYASQFAADFYRLYTKGKSAAESLSETQRAWFQPTPGVRDNEQIYRRLTASAHVFYAR